MRAEEEGAELAAERVSQFDFFSLQEPDAEFLSEIQRVVRAVTLAADEGIDGMPIGSAEFCSASCAPGAALSAAATSTLQWVVSKLPAWVVALPRVEPGGFTLLHNGQLTFRWQF